MSELKVSEEFINESKNLCQPRPKTSPRTKKERKQRRDEVFKLHFEYGYSGRKISEMMKVNRNTINSDIAFWFSKLRLDLEQETIDDWINKQFMRLESQRSRLRKELDSDISLQERLQVEKIILELDSKISGLVMKLETSRQTVWDNAVNFINSWMEKHGYEDRFTTQSSLLRIPEKSRNRIYQLLERK